MILIEEAFSELYPGKEGIYKFSLNYSAKFKPYNANVRLRNNHLEFNLSKKWERISREIQTGLIQELLLKILKNRLTPIKTKTYNIELYNFFMKKIHIAAPKNNIDPILEKSFNRVNEKYFYSLIEKPNLIWGNHTLSKLGSYEYGSDTITISKTLENLEQDILDYIMYHEMLHKKHKFTNRGTKNYHHTIAFKKEEREFENSQLIEKKLKVILRKKRPSFRNLFLWS